jgi:hypothetical protein
LRHPPQVGHTIFDAIIPGMPGAWWGGNCESADWNIFWLKCFMALGVFQSIFFEPFLGLICLYRLER